jgi:hypothetical protein
MNDRSPETQKTGYEGFIRFIRGALVTARILVGVSLFLVALVPLAMIDAPGKLPKKIRTSVPLNPETVDPAAEGEFISISGELLSEESIGDPLFLKNGAYIVLNREIEMYSWIQGYTFGKEPEGNLKKMMDELDAQPEELKGRRGERIGNHSYDKMWSGKPPDSSSFKHPEGHENPSLPLRDESFQVHSAKIGAYRLDMKSLERLPRPSHVSLKPDMFIPSGNARLENDYIFVGEGTLQDPEIGDLRIAYTAVKSGSIVTVFGQPNGETVEPYFRNGKQQVRFRAIAGSREEAIAQIASEQRLLSWTHWGFRVTGFVMTWVGLCLFVHPIKRMRDSALALQAIGRGKFIYRMFLVSVGWYLIVFVLVSLWYGLGS